METRADIQTDDAGRIVAYVSKDQRSLTTWQGDVIARLQHTGTSRTGFWGSEISSYRTLDPIAGYYWFGRGAGAGMFLRLRRGRKA